MPLLPPPGGRIFRIGEGQWRKEVRLKERGGGRSDTDTYGTSFADLYWFL